MVVTDDPFCYENPDFCEGWRYGYKDGALKIGTMLGLFCLIIGWSLGRLI